MIRLAKHAVAIATVVAAASMPVAAHAEAVSLNFTHLASAYATQHGDGQVDAPAAPQPR